MPSEAFQSQEQVKFCHQESQKCVFSFSLCRFADLNHFCSNISCKCNSTRGWEQRDCVSETFSFSVSGMKTAMAVPESNVRFAETSCGNWKALNTKWTGSVPDDLIYSSQPFGQNLLFILSVKDWQWSELPAWVTQNLCFGILTLLLSWLGL